MYYTSKNWGLKVQDFPIGMQKCMGRRVMHRLPKTEVVPHNPPNFIVSSGTFESAGGNVYLLYPRDQQGLALQAAASGLNWFKARSRQGVPFTA